METRTETEIYHERETAISLVFSKKQWKSKERHTAEGYGVRVLDKGRLGFSYCQEEKGLAAATQKAKALAAVAPKSRFSFTADKGKSRIKTEDRKLGTLETGELKSMLDELREGAQPYAEHIRIYAGINRSRIRIENPHWEKRYAKTGFGLYMEATVDEGYGFYHFSGIGLPEQSWKEIGQETGRMAQRMRQARRPASGEYDVMFAPEAFGSMLEVFLPSFSGDWKRRGTTPWASQIGQMAFDERFTIYEQGDAPASNARPFDDEGTPSRRKALVEKGVLKSFQYDRETAALERLVGEGGQCSREGYDNAPGIGGSNFVIAPGDTRSISEETKEYLYIRSLHGTHTANTTTGDFGAEVNMAFHVKGETRKPMRGFLLTGNVFNLFKRIECIERTIQTYDNLRLPLILFQRLKVVS